MEANAKPEQLNDLWRHVEEQQKKYADEVKGLMEDRNMLRLRLSETENALSKYRKYVLFDEANYERLLKLKEVLPFSRPEVSVLTFFS